MSTLKPSLLFTIAAGREQIHPQPVQQTLVVLLHMPIPESRNTSKRIQMWYGINITTNQRLSPTFRGNRDMISDGNSQMSLSLIFMEGRGASVHRLSEQCIALSSMSQHGGNLSNSERNYLNSGKTF